MLTSAVTGGQRRSATRDLASGPGGGCHKPPSDHNTNRLGWGVGGRVCDRSGEGRAEGLKVCGAGNPNDTEISSRRHKKRKRLRPFPVGKVPTSRVSMARRRPCVLSAGLVVGGSGRYFPRTAAEIDSLGLPEVSTRTSRTTRPGRGLGSGLSRRAKHAEIFADGEAGAKTTPRPQELHLRPRGSEVRLVGGQPEACRYRSYSPW